MVKGGEATLLVSGDALEALWNEFGSSRWCLGMSWGPTYIRIGTVLGYPLAIVWPCSGLRIQTTLGHFGTILSIIGAVLAHIGGGPRTYYDRLGPTGRMGTLTSFASRFGWSFLIWTAAGADCGQAEETHRGGQRCGHRLE